MIKRILLSILIILLYLSTSFAATQDRLPTGDGSLDNWTVSGCTNQYECVDDAIGAPDDATTYIYRADSNDNQMLTFAAFNISSTAITNVVLTARCRYTGGDGLNIVHRIQVNGTEYTGSAQALTTSWANYTNTWTTNPNTSSAWTETEVETLIQEFGVNPTSIVAGEQAQCTQIYLTVTYTAPAPTQNNLLSFPVEDFE